MIKTKNLHNNSECQKIFSENQGKVKIKYIILIAALSLTSLCLFLSREPDFDISLKRRYDIHRNKTDVLDLLNNSQKWKSWHFHLKNIETPFSNQAVKSDAPIHKGDQIIFKIEPPTRQWTRFDLGLEVKNFELNKEIHLKLISDSSGKITSMFENLEWKVFIEENKIIGEIWGKTKGARSRFYARLTPEILLNQVFYPDLKKMSGLANPDVEEVKSPFK